jgi:hypothetical protein
MRASAFLMPTSTVCESLVIACNSCVAAATSLSPAHCVPCCPWSCTYARPTATLPIKVVMSWPAGVFCAPLMMLISAEPTYADSLADPESAVPRG